MAPWTAGRNSAPMNDTKAAIDSSGTTGVQGRPAAPEGPGPVAKFGSDQPLKLDGGATLSPFQIAYKTYGALNEDRSNVVLVCHALTGDQYAAGVRFQHENLGFHLGEIGNLADRLPPP